MSAILHYPCPCCGYRTYLLPAGGTMELCPVCGWEDAPEDYAGALGADWSNNVSLPDAQANFLRDGACEEQFRDIVRDPLPEEARSPHWLSIEDYRLKTIAFIEEAFADVQRDGGITLHQREAIDEYGSEEDVAAAARHDTEANWQQIDSSKIARMGTSLVFLDPAGIRFHLPAFMRFELLRENLGLGSDTCVYYGLDAGPEPEGYYASAFELLTEHERQAVAAFLAFTATYGDEYCGADARKGLENGWDVYSPDFIFQF